MAKTSKWARTAGGVSIGTYRNIWVDFEGSLVSLLTSVSPQLWCVSRSLMATLGLSKAPLLIVHVILLTLLNLASLSALAISPIDRSSRHLATSPSPSTTPDSSTAKQVSRLEAPLWFHNNSHSQLISDQLRNPTKTRHFAHFAVKYHNAHNKWTDLTKWNINSTRSRFYTIPGKLKIRGSFLVYSCIVTTRI